MYKKPMTRKRKNVECLLNFEAKSRF